ncbi:MAG TPA: hypothetical protein VMU30_04495 [Bacteroidota bacterium]|nr:hypothetical protein [Bacteroidota bacterium]
MKSFDTHSTRQKCTIFLLLLSILCCAKQLDAQPIAGWQHVNYALYFTSRDVDSLLANPDRFTKTMEYFAPVKPVHVYLEGSNRGEVNVLLLKQLSEKFKSMGIKVSGALVPNSIQGPSVYNNAEDMASLARRSRSLAQVFDEIIIDDWLFTIATDSKSVADRGSENWAAYRTKLILEQSKKYIIDPAKKINPKVKVIIKYPDWYEGHRENGYDVYHETLQFDKMAVGIETRNRMVHDQHIPLYSAYVFQQWWPSVDPAKWVGSWLDNYEMKGDSNDYTAQVWQAVFAQTPEIILWCAGQLYPANPSSDVYPHFTQMLPEFEKVAGLLNGAQRGIPIYLPYGTSGEYNIFGYFGMAGIPLTPVAQFPKESKCAIFTLHSIAEGATGRDTNLANEMIERLQNGKDVFMTWELWKTLRNTEFKNTLNLLPTEGSVTSDAFRMRTGWFRKELVKSDRPFTFPKIETTTWPEVKDVAIERDDYDFGVLLHIPYMKGNIYILNMPDNSYDLLRLPAQALNSVRRAFKEELGFEFDGPGGVGLYLYGSKQYVLYNMSDETASMKLRFDRSLPNGWQELLIGKALNVDIDTTSVRFGGPVITDVAIDVKPFEPVLIQAP